MFNFKHSSEIKKSFEREVKSIRLDCELLEREIRLMPHMLNSEIDEVCHACNKYSK